MQFVNTGWKCRRHPAAGADARSGHPRAPPGAGVPRLRDPPAASVTSWVCSPTSRSARSTRPCPGWRPAGAVVERHGVGGDPGGHARPRTGSLSGERAALRSRGPGPPGEPSGRGRSTGSPTRGRELFAELLAADEPVGTDEARSFGLRLAFARHLAPQARLGSARAPPEQLAAPARPRAGRRAAPGDFDGYTRSLVEHSTETTEQESVVARPADRVREAEAGPRPRSTDTGPDPSGSPTPQTKGSES